MSERNEEDLEAGHADGLASVDEFGVIVTIMTSLSEAETLQTCLAADGEEHLAEHVKYCIQEAKRKAGMLQPARL